MTTNPSNDAFIQGVKSYQELPSRYRDLKTIAKEKLPRPHFDYIESGAGKEETLTKNEHAFQQYSLVPRFLKDVAALDTSIHLFGKKYEHPFLFAPVGMLKLAHEKADFAAAKAAAAFDVPFIQSTVSSYSMEEITNMVPDSPKWFQLYWSKDEQISYHMVKRAERLGYDAIVVTIDTTILGYRITDRENQFSPLKEGFGKANYIEDKVFMQSFGSESPSNESVIEKIIENLYHPHLNWDHIAKLKEQTTLPMIIKGVLHPEDALIACKYGIDGIIVSNHGGRQMDGAISSLDALPKITKAVDGKIPVLLDSGIRDGSDIIKALALGADAALIGRPFVYGLAANGQSGVEHVIHHFIQELQVSLPLVGAKTIEEAKQITIVKQ